MYGLWRFAFEFELKEVEYYWRKMKMNIQKDLNNSNANQPFLKVRDGALVSTVWKNIDEKNNRVYFSVTFEKIYKTNDEWKSTQSFNSNEILKLSALIQLTYQKLWSILNE